MTWGAVAVTVVGGYMTEQQRQAAQEKANRQNKQLTEEQMQMTQEQFEASQKEGGRRFDLSREDRFRGAEQNLARLDPYSTAGGAASVEQAALLGLSGQEAQAEAFSRFSESPGQSFLRKRQERSLLRNQAAIGGLRGGNVRTALQEQAFERAQTDYDRQLQRLGSVSDRGMGSASLALAGGPTGPGEEELLRQRFGYESPEDKAAREAEEAAKTVAPPRTAYVPPYSGERYGRGGGDEGRGRGGGGGNNQGGGSYT